jgi:hypothetical protein
MRDDEKTASVLDDLRALGEADALDEQFRIELAALLLARASADRRSPRTNLLPVPSRPRWRVRPAGALTATLVAVGVAAGFLLAAHRSASAEALLRRVAAVSFEPNQARHLVYDIAMTLSGRTAKGTGEIWIATDATGKAVRLSETLRLAKGPAAPMSVLERDVQTPLGVYSYDATHNSIAVPSRDDPGWSARETPSLPLPVYLFDGKTVARRLADLAFHGAARVRLLPQRVLDGVTVDAVQVDGWPNGAAVRTILYFDTKTHLLRGFDSQSTDPSYNSPAWRVRLAYQSSRARDMAPPEAFTLSAPASAQVQTPPPAPPALPELCGSQAKLLLSRGESLLKACRAGNPAITPNTLIYALTGSVRQDLAAAVAAGEITQAQARAALLAQRAQIVTIVTAGGPSVKPPAASGK